MSTLRIAVVVGTRPNLVKAAPLLGRMEQHPGIHPVLVHTGQHYDRLMSGSFFDQLALPEPGFHLDVGSGSHGDQTGRIMIAFEKCMPQIGADLVLVVGDVNSTLACGLVAAKMGTKLAHVEAGLRSFDRTMPEEINRVLTDQISDYLFATESAALANLEREGVDPARIFLVGNVMVDSLLMCRSRAAGSGILDTLELGPSGYILVTLHRPATVDDPERLANLVDALAALSRHIPVVFPIHPRTRKELATSGLEAKIAEHPALRITDALPYLDFLHCMANSRLVITDSGGIQEETTVLGVPCLTARDNTERPVTVEIGTNKLIGRDPSRIYSEARKILDGEVKPGSVPELWDGRAAQRIVDILWERERGTVA